MIATIDPVGGNVALHGCLLEKQLQSAFIDNNNNNDISHKHA